PARRELGGREAAFRRRRAGAGPARRCGAGGRVRVDLPVDGRVAGRAAPRGHARADPRARLAGDRRTRRWRRRRVVPAIGGGRAHRRRRRRASVPAGELRMSADRFEALYAATREPILAYLLRRVDWPEDAADLLADVYLVAWRRIDEVPRGDGARMWLYGVARRQLANHRRGDRRRTALASALAGALRSVTPPDDGGRLAAA